MKGDPRLLKGFRIVQFRVWALGSAEGTWGLYGLREVTVSGLGT